MNDHVHPIMRAALAPFAPRPATYICNRLVIAEKVAPPIPIRDFDWCAYFQPNDIGDPQGYGASRQEAIDDLRKQCN